jgi:hypothetical protein
MQGVAHALTASDGSASRLPMSRETMGQSGSNTRFNGENFSIAAALRSSPFGVVAAYTYGYLKTAASRQNITRDVPGRPGRSRPTRLRPPGRCLPGMQWA